MCPAFRRPARERAASNTPESVIFLTVWCRAFAGGLEGHSFLGKRASLCTRGIVKIRWVGIDSSVR